MTETERELMRELIHIIKWNWQDADLIPDDHAEFVKRAEAMVSNQESRGGELQVGRNLCPKCRNLWENCPCHLPKVEESRGGEQKPRMRFFIDTEFLENGPSFPLILLSIGLVAEDGRELYLVNGDAPLELANDWVKKNVIPYLGPSSTPINKIAPIIREWVGNCKPEFWGYYADYDWVVFCQLFGTMIDLPKGWPMFCHDIKQFCSEHGDPKLPEQTSTEHNALNDARWNKAAYEFLRSSETSAREPVPGESAPTKLAERIWRNMVSSAIAAAQLLDEGSDAAVEASVLGEQSCERIAEMLAQSQSAEVQRLQSSRKTAASLLTNLAGILDVVKPEWAEAWSQWDQEQRDGITAWLKEFYGAEAALADPQVETKKWTL